MTTSRGADTAEATEWCRLKLSAVGATMTEPMIEISWHPWSVVWKIRTDHGDFWMKQTTVARSAEGAVQAFCADLAPDQVDAPITYDEAVPRLLMADGGTTVLDVNPVTRGVEVDGVAAMLREFAQLQQSTAVGREIARAAGISRWDPTAASAEACQIASELHQLDPADPRHITAEQVGLVSATLPAIDAAGQALARSPISWSVDHGDLWPGNIFPPGRTGGYRFFDFGDARWSHPFLSLIMMVVECRFGWSVPDLEGRLNLEDPRLLQVLNAYLDCWTSYAPMPELRALLQHALRLAPLRRSRAWTINLDSAEDHPDVIARHGHRPWSWLEDVTLEPVGLA